MFLLYDVLRCKHLQMFYIVLYLPYFISVFFEIFKKKKFKFVVEIIYLSIYFSHVRLDVRLDYDNINTILLLFPKKKNLYFFPLWNCTLGFFKRKKSYNLLFFPFFLFLVNFNCIFFSFINFLDTFLSVFDFMVKRKLGLRKFVNLKIKV